MAQTAYQDWRIERLGTIMHGLPDDPREAMGVLNPATCRGPDGELYILPRVVAARNLSRVGIGRVTFDGAGDPVGVERLGYALEPDAIFEQNAVTAGVEDPRVTYVAALERYVMTYTAYGPLGPRVALAESTDLRNWRRLGPAHFAYEPELGADFNIYHNKDAAIFPEPVRGPNGDLCLAMFHRPDFNVASDYRSMPNGVDEQRPCIWLSYCPLATAQHDLRALASWEHHHLLIAPEHDWEILKVGGGTPPVRTPHGWVTLFHGVSGRILENVERQTEVYYAAGVLVLDLDDPRTILYRSPTPLLRPDTAEEQQGIVDNVVFPTGVDLRDDHRIDVYYGMADARIGVARLMVY